MPTAARPLGEPRFPTEVALMGMNDGGTETFFGTSSWKTSPPTSLVLRLFVLHGARSRERQHARVSLKDFRRASRVTRRT